MTKDPIIGKLVEGLRKIRRADQHPDTTSNDWLSALKWADEALLTHPSPEYKQLLELARAALELQETIHQPDNPDHILAEIWARANQLSPTLKTYILSKEWEGQG